MVGTRAGGDRFNDRARAEGYAARSVYKLEEIQRRFRVLRQGQRVVDLGCHPGSWTQLALKLVGGRGVVVGVDLQEPAVPRAHFLVRSVFEVQPEELLEALGGRADVVLSDMAPRTTGDTFGDHVRQIELARRAVELARAVLLPGGNLVVKVFDGEEAAAFVAGLRPDYDKTRRIKPEATRRESREFFVLGLGHTPVRAG